MSAALRFIELLEDVLRGGHRVRFRAPGWSMHPTICHDEIITVAPLGRAPVRTGDVLLYRQGRTAIAHRVIQVRSSSGGAAELVLRGDAAAVSDRPVRLEQVLGRVQAVERSGRRVRLRGPRPSWVRPLAPAPRPRRSSPA